MERELNQGVSEAIFYPLKRPSKYATIRTQKPLFLRFCHVSFCSPARPFALFASLWNDEAKENCRLCQRARFFGYFTGGLWFDVWSH